MPGFKEIIKKSISIVRNHKWLLVYGLVLAGSESGIGSKFNSLRSLPTDTQQLQNSPDETSGTAMNILGTYTDIVFDWFKNISISVWILIALAVFAAIIFSLIVSLILRNWAKGAVIHGINLAMSGKEVTLKTTTSKGIANLKDLIILSLIFSLAGIVITLLPLIAWGLIFMIIKSVSILKIIWVFAGVFGTFPVLSLLLVLLPIARIYAERLVILLDKKPYEAFKESFEIGRKNIRITVSMGIINTVLISIVSFIFLIILLIILGIPGLIILLPAMINETMPSAATAVSIAILVLIFVNVNLLIGAAVMVFKYANWNQIFDFVLTSSNNSKKS